MIDQRLMTFMTVCRTGNFTKAGELLNLTQPAVTKHIKSLEEYYGTPLFIRKGRSVELTAEGKILLSHVKDMEAQILLMERKLKNSFEVRKRYNIGATLTIGEYVLPYVLGKYKEANPNADIIMHVYNTEIITRKLLSGEIDLGLVEGPFDKSKFSYSLLREDELVFVASPQSQYAGRLEIAFEEIMYSRLILREEGSGTRKVLEDKLIEQGHSLKYLKPYMEIGSLGAIKSLVEQNLGCTIISKTAIEKEIKLGTLVAIPIKGVKITREFSFIYLKKSPKDFIGNFISFSLASLP